MAVSACLCVVHGLQALCQLLICFAYRQNLCLGTSAVQINAGQAADRPFYGASPGVAPMVGYRSTGFIGSGVGVSALTSAEQPVLSGLISLSMRDQIQIDITPGMCTRAVEGAAT